jgi:membrane protein YdbS with pleckstrin-like domain
MSYIDRNLLPGEQVVYRTRLHWLLFLAPVLFTVVVLLPIAGFVANGTWSHYAWIPLAIAILILLITYIRRRSSDFAVTNKRVMMKMGVFSTRSIEF